MTFGEAVKSGFSNYVNFRGRASRSEYWWWALFTIVLAVGIQVVFGMVAGSETGATLANLASLVLFLPSLAVGVRRLHDTDRSGLWMLIGLIPVIGIIVLIVFFVQIGTPGQNRFGPPPPQTLLAAPAR